MRIVFCIYDFVEHNLPLQPWLTIRHVAEKLANRGHTVHIVTDKKNPAKVSSVVTNSVDSLRGSNTDNITKLLQSIKPDVLISLPTPLNIISTPWLDKLACRRVGFASYSFYNTRELLTAARCIGLADTKQYLRHLFVPRPLWKQMLADKYDALIAQSLTTTQRLRSTTSDGIELHFIPPGITLDDWPTPSNLRLKSGGDSISLLYMGAAIPIRGFNLALEALRITGVQNIKLRILARGADSAAVDGIRDSIIKYGLNGRVVIEGGWLDRSQLIEEIHNADAVLQPFVIVPSEFPVTAMEVIACGTPVIGANINGLPSTIGPAGTVTQHGSAPALADAILSFVNSKQVRSDWHDGCVIQRSKMIDWETMVDHWEEVFSGQQ